MRGPPRIDWRACSFGMAHGSVAEKVEQLSGNSRGLGQMNSDATVTEQTLTRIPSGSPDYWRCVDFLVDEATALDENRLDDWLAMLHPEIDYRAPIRVTRERARGLGFSKHGYHFFENHESLITRIDRLSTDYAWAEDPPSRTKRFVSNFRVYSTAGGDDLAVRSNLLVYRERLDETHPQFLVG